MSLNKLKILSGFFQNNIGCKNNHLPRVKTKQIGMKKKYLYLMCWNQELPGNLPIIGKLFFLYSCIFPFIEMAKKEQIFYLIAMA